MAQNNIVRELADRCRKDYIIDGRKTIISCSKCGIDLVEIWQTKPYVKMKTKVIVTCGICGDQSFLKSFDGGFQIGTIEGGKVSVGNMVPGESINDGDYIVQNLLIETREKN